MLTDGELLQRYADKGSDEAFTELVQRHINMVHLAALRRVGGDAHSADDVAQRVFTDLARKAAVLKDRQSLAGWLHTGTRFAAAQVVRTEQRRRAHEQEAHAMDQINWDAPPTPERFEPFLDEVLDLLDERDRNAVLLHYFEGRTFAEVGSTLAMTADAARMRVNRALDRLRAGLANRGMTSTASALGAALATQAAQAAPARLAITIAGQALRQAGGRHGAATVAARLLRTFRSAPLVSSAGIVLTTAMVFVAVKAWQPTDLHPAAAVESVRQDAGAIPAGAANPPNETQDLQEPDANSPIAPNPPASGQAAPNSGQISDAFSEFSSAEKNILARLWALHQTQPTIPGMTSALVIGSGAPNSSGIQPLVTEGWLRLGRIQTPQRTSVSLTKGGLAYCQAHSAEIEAYGQGGR